MPSNAMEKDRIMNHEEQTKQMTQVPLYVCVCALCMGSVIHSRQYQCSKRIFATSCASNSDIESKRALEIICIECPMPDNNNKFQALTTEKD